MKEEQKNENETSVNNNQTPEVINNPSEITVESQTNTENESNIAEANQNTTNDAGPDLPKQEVSNMDFEDFREKKNKKGLIIVLCLISAILLLVIGGLLYVKTTFNATKFLDQSANSVNEFVNNIFDNLTLNKEYLNNIDKYELINDANIKLTTNSKDLKDLNNLEIGLKAEESLKNNYINMDINLKQDTGSLNGTLTIDNNKIYLDSKDIYDKTLTTTSDEDIFQNVNEYKEKLQSLTKVEDLNKIANNLINYLKESLKEASLNTKYNGLKATYTYEIDDTNRDKINNKFMKLISDDEVLKDYITEDSISVNNAKITVEVNILNKQVESFTIKSDESEIKGVKIDTNKYKVTSDSDEYEVEISKEKIVITGNDKNNNSSQAKIEVSNNKTMVVFTTSDTNLDITIENTDKETSNVDIKINSEDLKITGNMIIKSDESNKKQDLSGKLNLSYKSYNIGLDITNKIEYGNNLITKKDYKNTVEFENISDEDSLTILTNLMEKASKFKAYNFIQNASRMIDNIRPNSTKKELFALDANTAIQAASAYLMNNAITSDTNKPTFPNETSTTCITISELIDNNLFDADKNEYSGIIKVTKQNNQFLYTINITNKELMAFNKNSNDDITADDIESYNKNIFVDTCS